MGLSSSSEKVLYYREAEIKHARCVRQIGDEAVRVEPLVFVVEMFFNCVLIHHFLFFVNNQQ